MFIAGCFIIGFYVVEFLGVFGKARVSLPMNFLGAVAASLIAGAFVL